MSAHPSILRCEGEYWTISFGGAVIHLRDSKGLQYIAHLLRHPGQEFLAFDLATGVASARRVPVAMRTDSAPLVDKAARRAYKHRLDCLRDELDDAERSNDPSRAAAVREEIRFLSDRLAAAIGLGGRSRCANTHLERARWAVTKRIKDTIRRIAAMNPALGRHLTTNLKTGHLCAYHPDPERPISWTAAVAVFDPRVHWAGAHRVLSAVPRLAHLIRHPLALLRHLSAGSVHHLWAIVITNCHLIATLNWSVR